MQTKKRRLGKTDLHLNPIGLGAMPMSISGRPSREQSLEVLKAAIENGVDFIDTANSYGEDEADKGHSEALVREALQKYGQGKEITVATKGGLTRFDGGWQTDARPEELKKACEKSLKDLGVDQIELYYLHAADDKVPLEDSMQAMAELQKEGKIKHVAVSNFNEAQLRLALDIVRVEAVQNRCHPFLKRDFKSGLVEVCREEEIAFVAHSPVGGHRGHHTVSEQSFMQELAQKYGTSVYCICLNYLLMKSPNVFVIPGASKPTSILDSSKAADFEMSADDIAAIDALPDAV